MVKTLLARLLDKHSLIDGYRSPMCAYIRTLAGLHFATMEIRR